MEIDSVPTVTAKESMESTSDTRVKIKARKPRSTDHKVLRIYADGETGEDEGEFQEKKKRPKRIKRKNPTEEGAESMDTDASAAKKPHFAKLSEKQEMVG